MRARRAQGRRSFLLAALLAGLSPALALAQSSIESPAADPAWKRAAPGRPIQLPADHASHPDYRLEWWYYTGNLDAADGRRFGFQLTFFRVGVNPRPSNPSLWAVRDLFMTHFALTDVGSRRLYLAERLNRSGPGWAGAETGTYRVWNEDWSATLDGSTHRLTAVADSTGPAPVRFGVSLAAVEGRAPMRHGREGYSQKGADPGNASHYYSLPRMPTTGTLTLGGERIPVTGLTWMDHEFGTSFLEPEQIGWDWFAIQLSDGRSLMLYRFRRSDGREDPHSSGTLLERDGRQIPIDLAEAEFRPTRTWTSARSGARYPTAWTIRLPRQAMELTVTAAVEDQELRTPGSTGVTYWEGAVDVRGTAAGRPVSGRGYLELTGYSGGPMSNYLR